VQVSGITCLCASWPLFFSLAHTSQKEDSRAFIDHLFRPSKISQYSSAKALFSIPYLSHTVYQPSVSGRILFFRLLLFSQPISDIRRGLSTLISVLPGSQARPSAALQEITTNRAFVRVSFSTQTTGMQFAVPDRDCIHVPAWASRHARFCASSLFRDRHAAYM
jgi:hypothetical protein